MPEGRRERLQALLEDTTDWTYVLRQADRHRVWPLLHRHLGGPFADAVPTAVKERLTAFGRRLAIYTLEQTREMLLLVDLLAEHGIDGLPFKGPVLGSQVYGDAGLRQFGDLDILVDRDRYEQTRALLEARGYRPIQEMTPAQEEHLFTIEKSREYSNGRSLVELHWDFMHPMHGLRFDAQAIRRRLTTTRIGGREVETLAPEDLLIYLCAHGGKHFWERLSWVCDVAECLRTYEDALNWAVVLAQADTLHARRMVLLGVRLAAELLEAPAPPDIMRRAAANTAVNTLSARVRSRLFTIPEEDDARFDDARVQMQHARFHLLMRERVRDRLPYYRHLAELAVTPTSRDEKLIPLPETLSFLYYVVRPVRLLRDAVRGGPSDIAHTGAEPPLPQH